MAAYILRRLLLIIPTLLIILVVNFVIVQAAPGGPVEQAIAHLQGIGGGGGALGGGGEAVHGSRASRGLDPKLIAEIERQYGFDKPPAERLWLMLKHYASFDLGQSFFRGQPVAQLILDKMPVTLSLGFWATLITYLVSIPLGIRKAMRHGTPFDLWSSSLIILGYAMPAFLFAMFLLVVFAGGTSLHWFPVRGLVSEDFDQLSLVGQLADYFWHLVLPVTALVIGGFATLTMITKNAFLNEISRQYVTTARAKGLTQNRVLYGHVLRNAMLIVVAGLPQALVTVFFSGSLLIEVIFSLDGLGRLGYESAVARDYPVVFGSLFVFTLAGLLIKLVGDIAYTLLDPRIDFERRSL